MSNDQEIKPIVGIDLGVCDSYTVFLEYCGDKLQKMYRVPDRFLRFDPQQFNRMAVKYSAERFQKLLADKKGDIPG